MVTLLWRQGVDSIRPAERTSRAMTGAGLMALALAGCHVGPLSGTTCRMAAAVVIGLIDVALLWPGAGGRKGPGRRLLLFLALVLAGDLLITRAPGPEGPVAATTLAILIAIAVGRRAEAPGLAGLEAVATSGIVLSAFMLVTNRWPVSWNAVEAATRKTTALLGRLSGAGTSLGPSVAGIPLLVLVLAYLAARWIAVDRAQRPPIVLALVWVVLLTAVGWALGVPMLLRACNAALTLFAMRFAGEMPFTGYPASVAVFLPLALFLAWLAPTLVLADGGIVRSPARRRRTVPAAGLVAAGAAMAAFACWPTLLLPGADRHPRVVFPERGKLLGWEVPTIAAQGLENAGMFGMMPRYLNACGFRTHRAPDPLSADELAGADVVVVINPAESLPAETRARVEAFVRGGGGLLVLGDHTDILGTRGPLNELLKPYGVAFRFDSAFTPGHWHNDAGFLPGPLTRGLDDANSRFQQSTGASLALRRGAEPVATARWGFSDAGDHANTTNAFLGDYIYEAGEPLGDLPVLAMARHGRGRVVVFGDTSTFQNVAMPFSWQFVARVFQTAAAIDRPWARLLGRCGLLGWIVLAGAVLAFGGSRASIGLMAGTLLGLMATTGAIAAAEPAPQPASERLAVVDAAHFNAVSLDLWDPRALSALNVNLARNDYLPIVDREGSGRWLESAEIFVSVAPRRDFSRAEVERLRRFAENGGRVVLAVGWEDKQASAPLLGMIGLDLSAVPLGPVPVLRKIEDPEIFRRLQMEPHFASAWPVEGVASGKDDVLYASDEYPIVVRRPIGKGTFTLVADSRFLQNRTLEEEGTSWQGNVAFLRRLFEHSPPEPLARAVPR